MVRDLTDFMDFCVLGATCEEGIPPSSQVAPKTGIPYDEATREEGALCIGELGSGISGVYVSLFQIPV